MGKPGSYETLAKHIGARDMGTYAPISQLLVPISKLCITCLDPTKGLYYSHSQSLKTEIISTTELLQSLWYGLYIKADCYLQTLPSETPSYLQTPQLLPHPFCSLSRTSPRILTETHSLLTIQDYWNGT